MKNLIVNLLRMNSSMIINRMTRRITISVTKKFFLNTLLYRPFVRELNFNSDSVDFNTLLFAVPSKICSHKWGFCFLNDFHQFNDDNINWNYIDKGLLWNYNLNYFNYLLEFIDSYFYRNNIDILNYGIELIIDWIDNSKENKYGLSAYPTSLRIVNWIKFLIYIELKKVDIITKENYSKILDSLYRQAKILKSSLEKHLDNNHLTSNGKALLFAGVFLNDKIFIREGEKVIFNRIKELEDDGFHDEGSTSYFLNSLIDYCEIKGIISNDMLSKLIETKLVKMCFMYNLLKKTNGTLPLIADSFDGYPLDYEVADAFLSNLNNVIANGDKLAYNCFYHMSKSKLSVFKSKDLYLLYNYRSPSPIRNPGHSHDDALSIELSIDGKDFFVDPGTFSYSDHNKRKQFKSVELHNTINYGTNRMEIIGEFRLGKLYSTSIVSQSNNCVSAKCCDYKGRELVREIRIDKKRITIIDNFNLDYNLNGYINFTLNPQVKIMRIDGRKLSLNHHSRLVTIEFDQLVDDIEICEGYYSRSWNQEEKTRRIKCRIVGKSRGTVSVTSIITI